MNLKILNTGFVLMVLGLASPATGDYVLWDEAINGDLPNFPTIDLITMPEIDNLVIGTIGGPTNPNIGDGYDVFSPWPFLGYRISYFGIDRYQPVAGNIDSELQVYDYFLGNLLLSTTISEEDIGINLLPPEKFPNATLITVVFSEFDVVGQPYTFRVRATPEPDTVAFGLIIVGLIHMRERR